ncbi:hypothetical protein D3C72_2292230 [compost metagenome]
MYFTIPLTSKVQMSVSKGILKTKLPNPSLSVSYSWDSDYVRKYNPSEKFASSTIRDKVQDGLWGETLTYTLPKVPLYGEVGLKIISIDVNSKSELNLRLTP